MGNINYSPKQRMHRPESRLERGEYVAQQKGNALLGMDLPQTKLPPGAILAIREAAIKRKELRRQITEKYSNAALAKQWGVHESTIEKVLAYETGRHVR